MPLIDAAPLIIAHELGFSTEEGLQLELIRLGAWAQSRDMLGAGLLDAAHMLVPMPVGQALGLGPSLPAMDLVMFLSHGGQAVAVSREIERQLRADDYDFDLADARGAGLALRQATRGPLRVGVPFMFSTQVELIHHWLSACGFTPSDLQIKTVPPPMMVDALAGNDIDAFCVGEPWASVAVDRGIAALLLPGSAIWSAPPEKGLVLCHDVVEDRPEQTGALMRALWRACRWLDEPDHRGTAAEIVSRSEYLDVPSDLAERGLTGRLLISPGNETRDVSGFLAFNAGAANFPWKSLAALFANGMARRHGLDVGPAMQAAMARFRTDLYRQHLRPAGAALPGASLRVEGAIAHDCIVPAERGQMILRADRFFDDFVFDPPVPGPLSN